MRYPPELRQTTPVTVTVPDRPRWWQWPTVLSLDAPAIVVLWQALIALSLDITPAWPQMVVLGSSVWLAYTADRWIESWRLDHHVVVTARHRFHQHWRWPVCIAMCLVLAGNLVVATIHLGDDLLAGGALTAAVLAYLLSHQWLHRHASWRVPKELLVALLLGAGVWLFLREAPAVVLVQPIGLFTLLCLANTALISRWEAEVDLRHGQTSLALQSAPAARLIPWLPWITAAVAMLPLLSRRSDFHIVAACALASALLLALVDRVESAAGWRLARVLSDLALLTPIIPLLAR